MAVRSNTHTHTHNTHTHTDTVWTECRIFNFKLRGMHSNH